jgi:GTPase
LNVQSQVNNGQSLFTSLFKQTVKICLNLKELAKSAGAEPVFVLTGNRRSPDPKYFIGTGKLEELKTAVVAEYEADCVLFNHPLSPSQERNLRTGVGSARSR